MQATFVTSELAEFARLHRRPSHADPRLATPGQAQPARNGWRQAQTDFANTMAPNRPMTFDYSSYTNSAALDRSTFTTALSDMDDRSRSPPTVPLPRQTALRHAPDHLSAPPTGPPPPPESQQLLITTLNGSKTRVYNVQLDTETAALRDLVKDAEGACFTLVSLAGTQLPVHGTLRQANLPNLAVFINHTGPKGAGLDPVAPITPPTPATPPVAQQPATEEKGEFPPDNHPTPGLFFGRFPRRLLQASSPLRCLTDKSDPAVPETRLFLRTPSLSMPGKPSQVNLTCSARLHPLGNHLNLIMKAATQLCPEPTHPRMMMRLVTPPLMMSRSSVAPAPSTPKPSLYRALRAAEETLRRFPLPISPVRRASGTKGKESRKAKELRLNGKRTKRQTTSAKKQLTDRETRLTMPASTLERTQPTLPGDPARETQKKTVLNTAKTTKKTAKKATNGTALPAPPMAFSVHAAAPPMDPSTPAPGAQHERSRLLSVLPVNPQVELPPAAKIRPPFTPVALFTALPDGDHLARDMVNTIVNLRLQSRCLAGKPPHMRLESDKIHRWLAVCDAAAVHLGASVDQYLSDTSTGHNQLALLNSVVSLLQVPAKYLGEIIEATHTSGRFSVECPSRPEIITHPVADFGQPITTFVAKYKPSNQIQILNSADLSATSSNADSTVKAANRLIQNDRQATATKIPVSHGVVDGKPEVAAYLNKLHLKRTSELGLHAASCAQLRVSPSDCVKELQQRSGCKDAPYDCLGWSAKLLCFQNRASNPLIH